MLVFGERFHFDGLAKAHLPGRNHARAIVQLGLGRLRILSEGFQAISIRAILIIDGSANESGVSNSIRRVIGFKEEYEIACS